MSYLVRARDGIRCCNQGKRSLTKLCTEAATTNSDLMLRNGCTIIIVEIRLLSYYHFFHGQANPTR